MLIIDNDNLQMHLVNIKGKYITKSLTLIFPFLCNWPCVDIFTMYLCESEKSPAFLFATSGENGKLNRSIETRKKQFHQLRGEDG